MEILKQEEQRRKPKEPASISEAYEWSNTRVMEQTTINVLSATIIGTIAIIAWIRGTRSTVLLGMLIGALVGAALGAWIDRQHKDREQKKPAKTGQAGNEE